jgi:hypothetical protein
MDVTAARVGRSASHLGRSSLPRLFVLQLDFYGMITTGEGIVCGMSGVPFSGFSRQQEGNENPRVLYQTQEKDAALT